MREHFKKQLETSNIIDEEKLSELKGKSLYSEYDIGDKILLFMLEEVVKFEQSEDMVGIYQSKIAFSIVAVVERELDKMAEEHDFVRMASGSVPVFKKAEI